MKTTLNITPVCDWLEGAKRPLIIAGPCSAESEIQMITTAKGIAEINKKIIFRAGIWKPRTRPNSFEGVGGIGLEWMQAVKQETGLLTSTEVANAVHVEACLKAGVDILWIGARTTVNPFSVQEIADALKGVDIPVFVKNPMTPDLQLWLGALERINNAGITKIAAIHRGVYSYSNAAFRNDPRWEMAIALRTICPDLPIICDPSHICGNIDLIPYVSQKALDMDMHGLMIETHCMPQLALSDAKQQLNPNQLAGLLSKLVVRKSKSENVEFKNKLEELRESINKSDDELLQILMNRMQVAERIGMYKKENDVTILQANRWESLLNERLSNATMMGLSEEFVKALYILIHEESIRKQTEIMN
ncbi:MAG: bifunctional 3-deoxy-7-phosphoheptulonate synthase/chorismate mutase type II [Bacteroidetes bacterium]|nr:bifunctional 3-deoxy-7-phosphoheptulonate synthase/chorismate mutase type II [Bacteroidota bacterium]